MARHDKRGRTQSGHEHFTKLNRSTMETAAWRALSPTAQALYPWIKLEWRGPDANNNGKIRLSTRQAGERMGCKPHTAARAFRELVAKGFLVQTEAARLGTAGAARSAAYELTELAMPPGIGRDKQEGSKLFREWRPGADFPAPKAPANNPEGRNGKSKNPCRKTAQHHAENGHERAPTMPKNGMVHAENGHEQSDSEAPTMPQNGTSLYLPGGGTE